MKLTRAPVARREQGNRNSEECEEEEEEAAAAAVGAQAANNPRRMHSPWRLEKQPPVEEAVRPAQPT